MSEHVINEEARDPASEDSEDEPTVTVVEDGDPVPVSASAGGAAAPAEPAVAPAVSELTTLTAERDKLKEQLLRTAADFDNYRKRTKRDLEDARQRGKDDLIRDLLPVFDNLERAAHTSSSARDLTSVVEGVRMVLKLFEDTAERMGLSRIKSVGERFDPAIHEAIQQVETDAQPPGVVVTEVAPGYRFGERLVRPAMVIVARKLTEAKTPSIKAAPAATETSTESVAEPDKPPAEQPAGETKEPT